MKYYLTQYYTPQVSVLFDLTSPINRLYAIKSGFTYVSDNTIRCSGPQFGTQSRAPFWEKIAWLRAFLPTIEDGSYVVYEDCDSLNIGGDLTTALHPGLEFGMVQLRAGLDSRDLINWFNSGVIVLLNTPTVRSFLDRAWTRGGDNDETGMNGELKSKGWTIGQSKPICSLDIEWNCWRNNQSLCSQPYIKSWHGMTLADKTTAIQSYIKTI